MAVPRNGLCKDKRRKTIPATHFREPHGRGARKRTPFPFVAAERVLTGGKTDLTFSKSKDKTNAPGGGPRSPATPRERSFVFSAITNAATSPPSQSTARYGLHPIPSRVRSCRPKRSAEKNRSVLRDTTNYCPRHDQSCPCVSVYGSRDISRLPFLVRSASIKSFSSEGFFNCTLYESRNMLPISVVLTPAFSIFLR